MEMYPNAPRQRNRRADRNDASSAVSVQPAMPVQQPMAPAQPAVSAQPMYSQQLVQPIAPPQPMEQTPPVHAQRMQPQPRVMAQPRVAIPPQQVYPQQMAYQAYPQQMQPSQPYPPQQQIASPVQQQVQYAPRARATNAPWPGQPVIQPAAEVPHARARYGLSREQAAEARAAQKAAAEKARKEALERSLWQDSKAKWKAEKARRAQEKAANEKDGKPKVKISGWLTTAISLSLICVMALVAAYFLMQAYLVQQEEARVAAYEAILNNYHVTEQADGALRVTWQDAIERYSAQYNLQPAFVTAVIRNESSFRTNAVSSVGARGLMQMMPDTAEWIAGKLDDHNYTFDNMWDAETNIRYGCWYLGYLSRLFHGDAMLVCAAYHAGQTAVTQWLSDPNKSPDGVTLDLEKLPEGPTKQYIGRVTQTYGIYQSLLYPDEAFAAKRDAVPSGSGFGITIER